jgi:nucleoside-diphosphate-sugar epimerase
MRILITGINGFIGTNLVKAFKTYHTIYGLDIVRNELDGVIKSYFWNETEQIPHVDIIIHLAGKAHDTKHTSTEKEYFDINLGLTQKIFENFLKSNSTKFIFFSSVKAIADSVEGNILYENSTPKPGTPYGRSKLEAEKFLNERFKEYIDNSKSENKKSVYILRPSMIHGPGNKGNLNLLYSVASKGIPWPLGAFDNKRSFTSIDNLNFIINEIIEKDIVPGTYQIADDEPLSTNRIIELISEQKEKKSLILNISPKLINFIAKAGCTFHLPLNKERLKKLTENYVVSNEKIKKALNIDKLSVTAEEGMKSTLRSF